MRKRILELERENEILKKAALNFCRSQQLGMSLSQRREFLNRSDRFAGGRRRAVRLITPGGGQQAAAGLAKRRAVILLIGSLQYVPAEYRNLPACCWLRQSMSGQDNCYENAQAESFFRAGRQSWSKAKFLKILSSSERRVRAIWKTTTTGLEFILHREIKHRRNTRKVEKQRRNEQKSEFCIWSDLSISPEKHYGHCKCKIRLHRQNRQGYSATDKLKIL